MEYGTRKTLDQGQILELIGVIPGFLAQVYGKIKNGKSYLLTREAVAKYRAGQVVKVNWEINCPEYDERNIFWYKFLGLIGLKKEYKKYPLSNLIYVNLHDLKNVVENGKSTGLNFYDWFVKQTSCTIFLDEGHIFYDSYMALRLELEKRVAVLEVAHRDVSVYIGSQRCTAIHVTFRGNVNIFYKIEKIFEFWKWTEFQVTEFQEMDSSERPNEEREVIIDPKTGEKSYGDYLFAESQHKFFGSKKIYAMYNFKGRRGDLKESQPNNAEVWRLTWAEAKANFWEPLFTFFRRKHGGQDSAEKILVKDATIEGKKKILDKEFFSALKSSPLSGEKNVTKN